jgi:hypothetical protein
MTGKTVTRSVRLDEQTNADLELLAAAAGMTVSEYIRWAVNELAVRDVRVRSRRRALTLLATLPLPSDPDAQRDEMTGIGERVLG